MKILQKLKTFFKKKDTKPAPVYQEICSLVLKSLAQKLDKPEEKPKHLKEGEWKEILNKISLAFSVKQRGVLLKSLAKNKMQEKRVKEGFRLFEVYFKEL